jgi:hypothetical protein
LIQKSLTLGHAVLLSGRITTILIANMSCQDVWLDKGTTLGTSQTYTDKILQCNLEESELIPSLTEEIIPEADESTTQCENRPDTSSENMEKELQNQLKPTAMENEIIQIITTPIAEPSTATEKTNNINSPDQQQQEVIQTHRNNRGNITTLPPPPYSSSPRSPSLPCTPTSINMVYSQCTKQCTCFRQSGVALHYMM